MSPVTWSFAFFVAVGLVLYYAVPQKARFVVLTVMSLAFYAMGGIGLLGYICFTAVTTYLAGLLLGKLNEEYKTLSKDDKKSLSANFRRRKKIVCGAALAANFGLLFVLKYASPILCSVGVGGFDFVLPLGISFYIFQASGYVIDVFRGKYEPQKNFIKYVLFVSFFPQMIQGPIGRYDALSTYLYDGNSFDFENFREGFKGIFTGLFKKLVIADRASVVAAAIIDSYADFGGGEIAVGVLFYCIQLYCDFSGGIDLVRGVARLFGVQMAENFRRPLFSVSLTDFWRRWHMTLGAWMKDYLFYPITLSKPFGAFGKLTRRLFKGRAGKILPTSLATFLIYFVIGIWHGANAKYIVFGLWNGVLITAALLCEPLFVKIKSALKIDSKNRFYIAFCMARTALIVFFGRYITRASGAFAAFDMMSKTVTDFSLSGVFSSRILECGLEAFDVGVVLVCTAVLLILEYIEEKGDRLSSRLERKGAFVSFVYITACICVVVFLGFYRGGYISPEFIYKQF